MPVLHETIETPLPIDETFAFIADFANAQRWDPGVATSERARRGPGRCRRPLSPGRPDGAAASRRWSTVITTFEAPHRVVLTGDGLERPRRRRHPVLADARRDRIDYMADIRLGGWMRLLQPFVGGAFAEIGRGALGGMQRRSTTGRGRRDRDEGRRHRRRRQRPVRRLCAAPRPRGHRSSSASASRAATSRPWRSRRRPGPSRSTPASSSTTSRPTRASSACSRSSGVATQPSDMSFGSACRACGVEFGSRGAARLLRPARRWPSARPTCACSPTSRASTATRGRSSTRRRPTGLTLGEFLDDRRLRPRLPRPLPRPDHGGRVVHGAGPDLDFPVDYLLRFLDNHGLIGFGRALPWRTVSGRLADATSSALIATPARPARSAPATRSWPSPATRRAPTVRTGGRRHERFDAVVIATHADDALALLRRRRRGGARRPGRLRLHRQPGRAAHRRRGSCRRVARAWASWNVDTAGLPTRRATAVTMTYHMNRLQALPGPTQYFVSVNPGDRRPRRAGHRGARVQPPAVHVPDARRPGAPSAGCRATAARTTPAPTWATASTRTAAAPGFEVGRSA